MRVAYDFHKSLWTTLKLEASRGLIFNFENIWRTILQFSRSKLIYRLSLSNRQRRTRKMGTLPVVYSHQLQGFASNHFDSQCNKVNHVRRSPITSSTVSAAVGIESIFIGSCKVRQRLRRLSSCPSSQRSYTRHLCKAQLVQDFAPAASAGYAILLLGGGLFACKLFKLLPIYPNCVNS